MYSGYIVDRYRYIYGSGSGSGSGSFFVMDFLELRGRERERRNVLADTEGKGLRTAEPIGSVHV